MGLVMGLEGKPLPKRPGRIWILHRLSMGRSQSSLQGATSTVVFSHGNATSVLPKWP